MTSTSTSTAKLRKAEPKHTVGQYKHAIAAAVVLSISSQVLYVHAQTPALPNTTQDAPQAQQPAVEILPSPLVVLATPADASPMAQSVTPTVPKPDAVAAIATPVAPRSLAVVYSYTGADQSQTKPIMDDLRLVHPSAVQKNVGMQVALNVALLMLGGGGMSFTGVSKDSMAGLLPDDVKDKARLVNPGRVLLVEEMQRLSSEWLAASPKTSEIKFAKPLVVSSATWRLVYNSLSADDKTYQLKFDADIYKIRDKKSFFSNPSSTGKGCRFVSTPRLLDEWKANDYQAVVDLVPVAVAQCAKEFTAQLPDLLDLK